MIHFNHHIVTLLLLLTTSWSWAQTYVIPDAGFKQCLIDNYAELLDANDDLDIAAANAKTGYLYCAGDNIVDVDGLQHFTSLDTLNLNQNNLTNIDQVANLTQLKSIIVNNNELTSLPDLSDFNQLTELVAHENFISTSPALPSNSALVRIDLKQNNLNEFPSVDNQWELEYLDVSRNNNINTIPAFPALTNLKELRCYICGLTEVPDVSQLSALEFLDVGYNKILSLPDFSANTQLQTIHANNNFLLSFEPLTILPNLSKVRLYNNLLSFEDFEPLLNIPAYDDIYKIIPQWDLPNPLDVHYFEFDSINLSTTFAQEAAQKTYTWYKDGNPIWEGDQDTLMIDSAQIEDSGDYYFTITHPGFPDLTLTSLTTTVTVEQCLDPDAFTIEITGTTCEKAGMIRVTPGAQPQSGLTYILKSQLTAREFTSTSGIFLNLSNPEYVLYAQAGERCTKVVEESLMLPVQACEEAFFTPNGDGIDDTFYIQEQGTAVIYDKWGQKLRTLNTPTDWDGATTNGNLISPGYYTIDINDGEQIIKLSVVY